MNCEQANNLLSARLDGELAVGEASALEAHVAECPDCQAAAEAFSNQHAQMLRAFMPRRVAAARAERAILQIHTKSRTHWRWALIPSAAAAGFLLAVLLLHPWNRAPQAPVLVQIPAEKENASSMPSTAARLTLATGQVQVRNSNGGDWHSLETGGAVPVGASVRTAHGARCEFQCPSSEVRLDESTQLQFTAPRQLGLAQGRVWSAVKKTPTNFTIDVPGATVSADILRCDINCRSGTTTLTVFDGITHVRAGGADARVNPGQQLTIADGRLSPPARAGDLESASRWLDEILILKGRGNDELTRRVDDLMAQIGQEKMSFLYESEIRGLGDHCVVPLTRYIQSERSGKQPQKRVRAAQIVADCAQPWCIPYLIELLGDRDGGVRAAIAAAMQRLTGSDMGRSTEQWENAPLLDCQKSAGDWRIWWRENKDHIPGADQPTSPAPEKV